MATPAKLSKPDALARWEALEESLPCPMTPIESGQTGSTYAEDTIRITGNQAWIDWILSRIKPVLEFENESVSRLEILYTETAERSRDEDGKMTLGALTGSYACYVKAKSRGNGRGRPRTNNPKPAKEPKAPKEANPLRAVNAGLKLKAKPKNAEVVPPTPTKKGVTKPAYTETYYAIAKAYTDEETGKREYEFLEPIGDHPVFYMQTYTEYVEFDSAMERLAKEHKMKEKDLQKIEVFVNDDGTLRFEEF